MASIFAALDVTEPQETSQSGVRCQKCEIPADSYAMMAGGSICELCQFEEADQSCASEADRTCQVCDNASSVRSIAICGDELLVCASCNLKYFAVAPSPAVC